MRSHKEKVAVGQVAKPYVREHKRNVVIKGDDHVMAALKAVRFEVIEARKTKVRKVDLVVRPPGHKIRDHRPAGAVLDDNEIIAVAEKDIAGDAAAIA